MFSCRYCSTSIATWMFCCHRHVCYRHIVIYHKVILYMAFQVLLTVEWI
jgi:hypothetical protein